MNFIGVDNGNKDHCVNIINSEGKNIKSFTIDNHLHGFAKLLEELKKLKDPHIGIESIHNPLVDFLNKNGYKVYNLNPLKIKRFKEMYVVSGNKTDPIDSAYLSEYLRLNHKNMRCLEFSSEPVERLKHYSMVHDQLVKEHTRAVNQLVCVSRRCFPLLHTLFSSSAPKILLRMILEYPSWQHLKCVSEEKLIDFLKKNHYRTPKYIKRVMNAICEYDQVICPRVEASGQIMLKDIARRLLALKESLEDVESEMTQLLAAHSLSKVFLSLPGAGKVTAAKLIALIGDNKQRFGSANNMGCLFGTAPRNYQSGSYHKVSMRIACKKRGRNLLYVFSFSSLKHSAWARKFYDEQRRKGKPHSVAIRSLSNKWVRKIFFIWQNEVLYDENTVQKKIA